MNILLEILQVTAIIAFLISGIICLFLGYQYRGVVNIGFFVVNFIVFYGRLFLK